MLQSLPSEVYKMTIFWFLVFSAHLAIASSAVEVQGMHFSDLLTSSQVRLYYCYKDPRHKKEGMQLNLYHVKGLESSLTSTSPFSFSDMITKDEERVRSLHSTLANKEGVRNSATTASSDKLRGPNLLTTPLKSGLSIGSGNYYCSSLKASTLNAPSCSNATGSCVYKASYGDSSFSIGYLSQDLLTLTPSEASSSFVYGCGQDNQGLFGKAAGFLSIGTSSLTSSPYKFTPLLKNKKIPSLYFVDLTTITVAGKPIAVSASSYNVPTIIDSGTVITRLPEAVYNALQKSFVTIMSKKYAQAPGFSILDTCFKGSVKEMSTVPEIQMIFGGGAGLALEAHNSLIEIEKGVTCLAIASSSNPISIIGNYQQQTFTVAYDVANSKIGFAAGGCK
ncbi:hypothetical protein ACSQ67_012526 [Phaseolus vulgaris]